MKITLEIKDINSDIEKAMADYIQDTIDAFMSVVKVIENDYCKVFDSDCDDYND